jgi:hypothetical protein
MQRRSVSASRAPPAAFNRAFAHVLDGREAKGRPPGSTATAADSR